MNKRHSYIRAILFLFIGLSLIFNCVDKIRLLVPFKTGTLQTSSIALAANTSQKSPKRRSVKRSIKNGAKEVGHSVKSGARETGHAIKGGVKSVGHSIKRGGKTVGHSVKRGAKSVGHFFRGIFK